MSDSVSELKIFHDKLRRAEFDAELLAGIRKHDDAWQKLAVADPAAFVQGRCVVAETYDYFGDYGEAEKSLASCDDHELEEFIRKDEVPDPRDYGLVRK